MEGPSYQLPPKFRAMDPALRDDPYPTYAALREAAPLCRGGPGEWVVTRYADVARLLRDPRLRNHFPTEYHQFSAGAGAAHELMQRILLHQDHGNHARVRAVFAHSFGPEAQARLRGRIRQLADALVDAAMAGGEIDAVGDLAAPLPVMVILEIVGMDHVDRHEIRRRVVDLGKAFTSSVAAADRLAADAAAAWLREYVSETLARRRRNPLDDLLSAMAQADVREFDEHELVDNVVFLLFAGFETTTSVIATGWAALLERPDQLALLLREPALVPRAVEEFIRYDSPIQSRLRFVHDPIEMGDRTIRPGRMLLLLLGSANRDPRQFVRPDDLDVARTPNPHVGFGVGDHYCLGAGLARMETAILLQSLLDRITGMEPAGAPMRAVDGPFRGYERLPVRLFGKTLSNRS